MKAFSLIAVVAIVTLVLIWCKVNCRSCSGKGSCSGEYVERTPCSFCAGRGTRPPGFKPPGDVKSTFSHKDAPCPRCRGAGYTEKKVPREGPCPYCGGKGRLPLYTRILHSDDR